MKHALNMLGTKEVRKWSALVALTSVGHDLPREIVLTCVQRGCFLEQAGIAWGKDDNKDDFFFTGIFSMIDLFAGRSREEILNPLPLKQEVKETLIKHDGPFYPLLALANAYEAGDWNSLRENVGELNLADEQVAGIFFDALDWSEKILHEDAE